MCVGVSVREIWHEKKKGHRYGWEKEGNWEKKEKGRHAWVRERNWDEKKKG